MNIEALDVEQFEIAPQMRRLRLETEPTCLRGVLRYQSNNVLPRSTTWSNRVFLVRKGVETIEDESIKPPAVCCIAACHQRNPLNYVDH